MDEKINPHDLLLENEGLRKELHRFTQTKDELRKSQALFKRAEKIGKLANWVIGSGMR